MANVEAIIAMEIMLTRSHKRECWSNHSIAIVDAIAQAWMLTQSLKCKDWNFVGSGSVVVTAYDIQSGHPGSNPEWG